MTTADRGIASRIVEEDDEKTITVERIAPVPRIRSSAIVEALRRHGLQHLLPRLVATKATPSGAL